MAKMIRLHNLPCSHIDLEKHVTSEFGKRNYNGMTFHNGIDLAPIKKGVDGDEVLSVADGIVRVAKIDGSGINNGYGRYIVVEHDGWCTMYAHLSGFKCKVGDKVKSGQIIGFMGNTGDSTGTHLHFEIRNISYGEEFWKKNGDIAIYAVNPRPYLSNIVKNHWGELFLNNLHSNGIIVDYDKWSNFDEVPTRAEVMALASKIYDKLK